jgi:hypothetical protein
MLKRLRVLSLVTLFVAHICASAAVTADFPSCVDPENRDPRSVLAAAISGPRYSSREYRNLLSRFQENLSDQSLSGQSQPAEPLPSHFAYLQELEFQSRLLTLEATLRMMWEAHEPTQLAGSMYNVENSAMARQATSHVCQANCTIAVRTRLLASAKQTVQELEKSGIPRRNWADLADEFNADQAGFLDILTALREPQTATRPADYWRFLSIESLQGVGRLWQTSALRETVVLPLTTEALGCVVLRDCELPTKVVFDRYRIGDALREFYQHILYQTTGNEVFVASESSLPMEKIKLLIAGYYRYFPLAVSRLIAAHPSWLKLQCDYLAMSLGLRGEEQNAEFDVHEVMRLLPMTNFFLLGLTSGILNRGRISGLAFTFATALELINVGLKSHEINQASKVLWQVRGGALSGQLDDTTYYRFLNSVAELDQNAAERDRELATTVALMAVSFGVGRIVLYGIRGAWSAAVSVSVLTKARYYPEVRAFLRAHGNPWTTQELDQFLRNANTKDLKELRMAINGGKELSLPAGALSIYELRRAFDFSPGDISVFDKSL